MKQTFKNYLQNASTPEYFTTVEYLQISITMLYTPLKNACRGLEHSLVDPNSFRNVVISQTALSALVKFCHCNTIYD